MCARSGSGTELGVSNSVFGTSDSFNGMSDSLGSTLGASSFGGSRFLVGSACAHCCVESWLCKPIRLTPTNERMAQWRALQHCSCLVGGDNGTSTRHPATEFLMGNVPQMAPP